MIPRSSEISSADGALLRRVRRRYHRLRPVERPPLDQPENVVGLLSALDCVELARAGTWPLSEDVQVYVATPPRKRRRRKLRLEQLLELAEEQPDELRDLLWAVLRRKRDA
jgi:hypothetical protein